MATTSLAPIDYLVVVAYLAGTVALGLYVGKGMHTGKDFFLAGRRLPWWAIGLSLVATDIGGTDIIGVGGAAYRHGLAVGNFEWIGCVPAMILAAFIFAPYFWRAGVYTIPEFMERRFNVGVRTALAFCWLVFMACNLGVMLYASAKMTATLFGWNELAAVLLMAALVGVYTYAGGLAAVVYTDVIQGIVMIGGCLIVLAIGIDRLGGVAAVYQRVQRNDLAAVRGDLDRARAAGLDRTALERELDRIDPPASHRPDRTRLILPVDTSTPFPWTGILFGLALILSPAYWIGNQAIIQRSLGARSDYEAKAAYIWGALLKNLIPLIIAVPGLVAFAHQPALADADAAFPTLVAALMPAGMKGLFVAAFLAALMSSVDSYLNSAATILVNDIYRRFVRPTATDTHLLTVGRVTTVVLVGWAIAFALYLSRLEGTGIYTVFQTLMAFFQGPALAILLCGLLWRRATGPAALVGFVTGVATAVTLFALSQERVYTTVGWPPLFKVQEPYLYFSVWSFLVTLGLVVALSFVTRPEPAEKIEGLILRRGGAE